MFALLRFLDEPQEPNFAKMAAGIHAPEASDNFYNDMGGLCSCCVLLAICHLAMPPYQFRQRQPAA